MKSEPASKNLSQKLVEVMKACYFVPKNGVNDFHHYSYVTSSDILAKVNAALVDNNICCVVKPELIDQQEVQNLKGHTEHLATVKVTVQLINADNSAEQVQFTGIGSGQDAGDKAVMKAQTAALKYAYMLSLNIATGDDPEADAGTDKFGNDAEPEKSPANTASQVFKRPAKGKAAKGGTCAACGSAISEKVELYSQQKFGLPLCMDCQKKQRVSA